MGGSSSSASSSSQTTNNVDKRLVVDSGVGVTADNSTVNLSVQTTDAEIVSRALDTVDMNNATNQEGFSKLLDAADTLFQRGENLIGQTQQSVADAYTLAQTTKAGTIDNKTMIVLAIAGAATVYAINRKS
jgi:hypothetical protein